MCRSAFIALAISLYVCAGVVRADKPQGQQLAFFEKQIRPVLVEHCYECHSADADELGAKLRLDDREVMSRGGESGPAVVAGKPAESLILQALRYDGIEMPPSQPLPASVIKDFETWIANGALDPRSVSDPDQVKSQPQPGTEQPLWSLRPIADPVAPRVRDQGWPRNDLDRFVLARMEAADLLPSDSADAATLVRRIHYDLIGLPPTIAEVESFVAAAQIDRQRAIDRLVDDLLARPQFGERWGRYWLDVARFAESNGNDGLGRNPTFPHAWRYRDYVVDSFNADVPYDRFLTEQIAGDLLAAKTPQESDRNKTATGFLALASKPAKAMNNNFEMDVVADQIEVIGLGVMGLSVGCARCHDHKFDPISTNDYYSLAGIFTSTATMWGVAANEKLTAPPTDLHVLQTAAQNPPPPDFVETVVMRESATGKPKEIPKSKWPVGTPLAMGVRDREKPADCKVNIKGDAKQLGESVPRGFLSAIGKLDSAEIDSGQSGRLALARWITNPRHPLTARVMVNRIWLHLFGEGLVRTPDDFGLYGQRPTHPLLLDHLATRFMRGGWSVKDLIREIVMSRTYRQSSHVSPVMQDLDPENRLLTRHDRRRLDAEALRDSMLAASGQLDLSPLAGSIIQHRNILVNRAGNLHQPSCRRSLYLCYLRSSPPPELAPFDLPDFSSVTGQREVSTVPGQSLHLLNSPFVIEQARCLSERIQSACDHAPERVRLAYRLAMCREPGTVELDEGLKMICSTVDSLPAAGEQDRDAVAWASFCQALFMTNEFRYVD